MRRRTATLLLAVAGFTLLLILQPAREPAPQSRNPKAEVVPLRVLTAFSLLAAGALALGLCRGACEVHAWALRRQERKAPWERAEPPPPPSPKADLELIKFPHPYDDPF